MERQRRKAWLGAIFVALLGAASARASDDIDVRLRQGDDRAYEVQGLFLVQASTSVVWNVLADYEGIPSFVSSMRSSKVAETRGDGVTVVEQVAVGGMFFVSKAVRVRLEVRRAEDRMDFTDVSREDFRAYDGDWEAQASPEGALVSYHLHADPRFPAPGFVMRGVMRRGARDLLDQVRKEIERRAHGTVAMVASRLESPEAKPDAKP